MREQSIDLSEYITVSVVARMCGCAPATITYHERRNRIQSVRLSNGIRLFNKHDAEKLAAEIQAKRDAKEGDVR